ncbi:2215_t:CDS:2 [Funneliformis caledonium]|nr:2215_t:CDS:2 [Funneliformis caledonium]
MTVFFYNLDLSKLKLRRHGFPQHITGNEKWVADFIYPNHWKSGSIIEVSHKIGLEKRTQIIIPKSKIVFLLVYVSALFILSWMWEPKSKNIECVKKSLTPELY